MSDVIVFDLFGLLQVVSKYPCVIPQQCSLDVPVVFVLHPYLFFGLLGVALIGFVSIFLFLAKNNFGVDLHE